MGAICARRMMRKALGSLRTLLHFRPIRRCGLVNTLLENELEAGRASGHRLAQISTLIGNTPAQTAYEKIGFVLDKEKQHPDYEAIVGVPGMMRLLLIL